MGRKCSTFWDEKSCTSGYYNCLNNTKEYRVIAFPKNNEERQRWINSLPNVINLENVTENMGVCERHWPEGYATKKVLGSSGRPADPPSVFGKTSPNFFIQTASTSSRNILKRKVTADDRTAKEIKRKKELDMAADKIGSWDEFLHYCRNLNLAIHTSESSVTLCKLDGMPPRIDYTIEIEKNFKIRAFKGSKYVSVEKCGRIKGGTVWHSVATKYSDIDGVIKMLSSMQPDISKDMKHFGEWLLIMLREYDCAFDETKIQQITFLCKQLIAHDQVRLTGTLLGSLLHDSLYLFLCSRSAYKVARKFLLLPNPHTITRFFGTVNCVGNTTECNNIIKTVFNSIDNDLEKICFLTVDEVYVKASVRYRSNKIIGMAHNDPSKPAKTVLAVMVNFMLGTPAFVARLVPVCNIEYSYQEKIVLEVINSIHNANGLVDLVLSDNLSVNRKMFKNMHKDYGTLGIHSVKHPLPSEEVDALNLFSDPVHGFKNIRNNWISEKTQILIFKDPTTGNRIIAKFSDIKSIYHLDAQNTIKMTKLTAATINPNSFERQKVQLVVNIFDEKVVAALKLHNFKDTAVFVERVTRMWHILNIKTVYNFLNDPDREPFRDPNDARLDFLIGMATSFKIMDSSQKGKRVKGLTSETANGLHTLLHGIVDMIRVMLTRGMPYVLPGKIQSDRLEREFGLWRNGSGSNYYISVEQVMSSLNLRRIKLYKDLNLESGDIFETATECCKNNVFVKDEDLDCLDDAFENASSLNEQEKATLYYICGYIAFKEKIGVVYDETLPQSEFTEIVSRGSLSHPPLELYDLSQYCYAFFESCQKKCCSHKFLEAFIFIHDATGYNLPNTHSIFKRMVNCFMKAHAKQLTDKMCRSKKETSRKKRKLENGFT